MPLRGSRCPWPKGVCGRDAGPKATGKCLRRPLGKGSAAMQIPVIAAILTTRQSHQVVFPVSWGVWLGLAVGAFAMTPREPSEEASENDGGVQGDGDRGRGGNSGPQGRHRI